MNNDSEKLIREALRKQEAEHIDVYAGDPGMLEAVLQTYQSRWRWLAVCGLVSLACATGTLFFCGYKFFQAEEVIAAIGWANGFVFAGVWGGLLKMWSWGEMSRYTVLREVKRVELQLAKLSEQLEEQSV